jgi:hypothetical protein
MPSLGACTQFLRRCNTAENVALCASGKSGGTARQFELECEFTLTMAPSRSHMTTAPES